MCARLMSPSVHFRKNAPVFDQDPVGRRVRIVDSVFDLPGLHQRLAVFLTEKNIRYANALQQGKLLLLVLLPTNMGYRYRTVY